MADALENQIMLQRLFAPTTEPLERLGQGQLALAQQNMLRQQALADQARAIIEAGKVRQETQTFQAEEAKKYRTFQAGESTKSQIAQELRSYEDNVQAYNRLLKGAELTSAENKANREALVNQQKLQADTAKELESIRSEHQKQYIRMNAELEKEGRQAILAGQMDANTATFWALNELEKSQQPFIDNEYKVDIKDKNKIVRQIVESHKSYGKNTDKLNKWLDPNSTSDISLSLSRVVDPKDLRTIQQDIDAAMDRYLVPQRVRAQKAQDFIEANMRLKAEAMSRPGGVNLKQLQDYLGVRGGGALPRELTDYLDRNKPHGAVGGAAVAPGPAEINRVLTGGARQPMGPPAPTAATGTSGVPPEVTWGGPPGVGASLAAMGPPLGRAAEAGYWALMNPTKAMGGVINNLNQSAYDMLQPKYNPVPAQFPRFPTGAGGVLPSTPMMAPLESLARRLPNVQNMADAIAPYAQPAKPLFGDPLQGFKDWQYQGIYNALAPSDTTPDQTIPPRLFIRMRQIAMRENPAITDAQITEGLNRARQGDPNATRILNHYKQLAIQSLAAESQSPYISTDSPPAPSF